MTATTVQKRVTIDASLTSVFEYLDDPSNQPEFTPSLTHSETLDTLPNGGKRVAYTYTMAGIDLTGELEATTYEPQSKIVWELGGDLEGSITWEFEGNETMTTFTYQAQYEIPVPVLDAVIEPFARRYNERELSTAVENIKTRLEAKTSERSN
jgi:uncharacterized protein YndB with AHSA1/START domain